jgi:putative transport protein
LESIGAFLDSQPFIALFVVIGVGYAVGRISVGGLSLGIGACLFVGLAVGAIAPKSAPVGLLGTIGLILYLYGIGIQYGRDFFKGLASPFGIKANMLAAVAVVAGCVVAVWMARALSVPLDFAAGTFAGTMTSTASLQAAMSAAGNADPATGYAIAYPFGVFGPILCFLAFSKLLRPKIEVPAPRRFVVGETRAGDRGLAGATVAELMEKFPAGLQVFAVRRRGVNMLPEPSLTLEADDVVAVAGLPDAVDRLGLGESRDVRNDRSDLDYVRVFVSRPGLVGTRLADLRLPEGVSAKVVQIRRGDVDLLPAPDLTIEYGDQVGVLVEVSGHEAVSRFFGDSIKAEAEFSFISLAVGMVLGGLIGLVPIPVPGIGSVTLGIVGGPLVVSLILGYFGRLGPFNWRMPLVANIILRNFGLTIFLAVVGLSNGAPFVANIGGSGLVLFTTGVVVLLTTVLIVLVVGCFVLGMRFDDLVGIVSGAIGNPAILAYANQLAPTGRPDLGYAMIFPGVGTILKLILVQVMVALGAGEGPP